MKNVVVFHEPKMKPLPPSITKQQYSDAALPVKFERAKQALIACHDLSELMDCKDQIAAICGLAKAAKKPDLAEAANGAHKEAVYRLGLMLVKYSSGGTITKGHRGYTKSERRRTAEAAGIDRHLEYAAVRLAESPAKVRKAVLSDASVSADPHKIASKIARLDPKGKNGVIKSDAYVRVMNDSRGRGIGIAVSRLRIIDLADVRALAPDEKKMVRAKVTEAMELLDAIEHALSGTG